MKITKEVRAALLVLGAIVLLIFGYNFLRGNNLLESSRTFYAMYDDVEGLSKSASVTINGLKVGEVLDIDFADESGNLKVTFNVTSDFRFGKNSLAQIHSTGLVSANSLAIIPEKNPKVFAEDGMELKSKKEIGFMESVSSGIEPLQENLNSFLTKADKMIESLNKVFTEENTNNIGKSIKDLSTSLNSLKYTSGSVQTLLSQNEVKLSQTITNFKETSEQLKVIGDKLSKAPVDEMVRKLDKTVATLSEISNNLKTKKGTAGKLLNDDAVYDNLDRATRQLDLLLQDIKLNPKRYVHFSVFGKKDKEYEKPKDSLK